MLRIALSALLLLPSALVAQTLPTAQEILNRHLEAVGGRAAILAISSVEQRGTLELASMGMTADVVMASAKPNRRSRTMSLAGLGEVQQGFNGEVGWSNDPMSGPRVTQGEELTFRKESASFYESFGLYDLDKYSSVEVVEKTSFGGEETYKVRMARKVGPASTEYFSVATGLRVGSETTVPSPMGNVETSSVVSEYKTIGAVKIPTKIQQSQAGQNVVITLSNITFDTVTDEAFALPDAVKALVKP